MAESQWPFLAAVLLLASQGLQCSPVLPTCPGPCPCQRGPLLNCSSSGLSTAPGHIRATVNELDLSHNLLNSLTLRRPQQNLQKLWLGSNSIAHLSLCMGRTATSQDVKRASPHPSRPRSRQRCLSWAPTLQLLCVERNQLVQLPEGLGGSESLRVLQLSYNRISTLRPGDLSSLLQLRELHLQHNHLTSLHPQAFRDLSQLRVLDLSFNLLTTLPPSTYLSLRNLGAAEVDLCGNRWQCDCSMRSARRWMFYDRDRGQPAWRLVCDSPSALSGRDLLQLEEGDLTCTVADSGPELHQDVTVDEGSDILLQCSSTHKDSTWWTPNGQVSVNQSEAGLLIRDVTERDTGLYVCMSESQQELVFVFTLQIWKTGERQRKTRSPRSSPGSQLVIPPQGILDRMAQMRNDTATQSDDLALAVSLSVILTFLVAFILGVLARPLIDILWSRTCTKKTSSATYSVSSAEQRPYDNDGYSDGEEPEVIGAHRERRVTFSTVDFREYSQASNSNVPYYDTEVNQESIHEGAVKESGTTYVDVQEGCSPLSPSEAEPEKKKPEARDSDSDSSSQQDSPKERQRGQKDLQDVTHPGTAHSMEFEYIPDPEDLGMRRSSSSHSETSHSDQENRNEDQMAQKILLQPQSTQKVEDTTQLRSQSPTVGPVEVPHISIDCISEVPGFTSEPFADWLPNKNESDIWNDSGESFEFSDSFRGASPRSSSVLGSLDHSKQNGFPPSDNWKRHDSTSSSSTLSGDEITHYTVNPEREEDEDIEANQNTQFTHDTKPEIVNPYLSQDISFEQQIPSEDPFKTSICEEGLNQSCSDSRQGTQIPPMGTGHSDSSSSSDNDDEPTEYRVNKDSNESDKSTSIMVTIEGDRAEEISPAPWTDIEPKAKQADLTLGVPSIKKKRKAPLPPANRPAVVSSSSSSESDAETSDHTVKQNWDGAKVGITSQEPETKWPDLAPQSIPKIKTHLDIKAPSPPPSNTSSSSSESEDKTRDTSVKQERREEDSQRTETRWPDPGLSIVPSRHLDIKVSSPPPKSSSSSSEDETTDHKVQWGGEEAKVPEITYRQPPNSPVLLPPKTAVRSKSDSSASSADERKERAGQDFSSTSTKVDPESGSKWPDLGVIRVPRIKRRLDIKAPSPQHNESSSSSESDKETKDHTVNQERDRIDVGITSHESNAEWLELSPQSIPKIKRHLDIKAPSPDTSSSSISFDHSAAPGPRPAESSSSSSESDDENKDCTVKQEGEVVMVKTPVIGSLTPKTAQDVKLENYASITNEKERTWAENISPAPKENQEARWAGLGLGISRFKKRLDITSPKDGLPKVPTIPPPKSSSSSSESEDERKDPEMSQKKGGVELQGKSVGNIHSNYSAKVEERSKIDYSFPATEVKPDPWSMWIGMGVPSISRHVDIKIAEEAPPAVPAPLPSDSYSSSESEDETSRSKGFVERAEVPSFPMTEPKPHPGSMWTGVPSIKRRLDIKIAEEAPPAVPSPRPLDSSSSSESEDETSRSQGFVERAEVPSFPMTEPKPHPGSMWTGVPSIKRRLDIKIAEEAPPAVPAPLPPDSSSSSESEDETSRSKGFVERAEVPSFPMTEPKPHPGSMWTGVPSIKRRLDIKIPEEAPPAVLSPRPLDSSSSSESEDETSGLRGRTEGLVIMHKELPQSSDSLYSKRVVDINFDQSESSRVEREPTTKWPALDLSRVTRIKRRLDIKAPSPPPPQIKSSSSSDSEDETTGQTVRQEKDRTDVGFASREPESKWPDLDLQNIPHIKRRLDIKAPSLADSPSSRSSSEDETKVHTVKQGKGESEKLIITGKDPPLSVGGINVSLPPRRAVNIGFDDVVRRRLEQNRHTPDVDLAPELQWQGIGRYSPSAISISQESRTAHSTSSLRRQVYVDTKPTQEAAPTVPPPATSSSSSSSSESENEIEQDGKAKITMSHDYSSIGSGSVSLAPRRALDIKFANSPTSTDVTDWRSRSEDRRGLTALKAMSSERQTWDPTQGEQQTGSYSVRQSLTSTTFRYESFEKDQKSPISTLSNDETRAAGSHRISRLRRRAVVAFQPPQEIPPPVPGTAPPPVEEEAAAGSTWRSPQSSAREEWSSTGSYQQREMSVDGYIYSSMSSESKRNEGQMSPSFIGLMGATPYHPHTAPKRFQRVTSSTTTQALRIDREERNTSSTVSENHSVFDYSNSISEV